ncbi:MAG TPA: sigma 54-interacting transcriptional regulator [Phycisphaerae bacterium]|nr:sigma 54-interacting transcriptional regulator [Phycisphaerae bacterium]
MPDDKFIRDLETVVYSCHAESHRMVREVFDKHGLFTYSFAEYFLDEPVVSGAEVAKRKVYLPFLARAAMELKYQIKSSKDHLHTSFQATTRESLQSARKLGQTGRELAKWKSMRERIVSYCDYLTNEEKTGEYLKHWEERKTLSTREKIWSTITVPELKTDAQMIMSYHIQLHLWSTLEDKELNESPVRILRIPIASRWTYYGQFLVVYRDNNIELEEDLKKALKHVSESRYVPTLTLLHVSKWEKLLRKNLKKMATAEKFFNDSLPPRPLSLAWQESRDEIEEAFGKLWDRRRAHLAKNKYAKGARNSVEESIILDKYHIASPAMVNQVREVIRGTKLMRAPEKQGTSLPSALVFGEAGSGKDKMARLIPTLTEKYFDATITTQNMAAIKPAALAVPIMLGVDLKGAKVLEVPGLFSGKSSSTKTKPGNPDPRVFILDELNSLDYDMQGSLLRLLENGEVVALFSNKLARANALIVGIVNEDPEEVTRESEFRLLKNAEEFLGKAEAARLYESLHSARRLRPDLIYRLKRGVYVRMPALRERREDIPLLFRHECTTHLEHICKAYLDVEKSKVRVEYELEVYDILMRPDLPWPGNIRQLQTVASRVAGEVWSGWNKKLDKGFVNFDVRRAIAERFLRAEFPAQMGRAHALQG